jgi:excisionase family DNA binding protein
VTKPVTWSPSASAALERIKGKLFCTTTEAGAVLRYDHRTIRVAIEEGQIPGVRVGATWRVPVARIMQQVSLGADGGGNPA